jgi:phosphomevalonate kinase
VLPSIAPNSHHFLLVTLGSTSKNKFVHLALQKTLGLAVEAKGEKSVQASLEAGLDIAIVGDNDFYSQRAKVRRSVSPL